MIIKGARLIVIDEKNGKAIGCVVNREPENNRDKDVTALFQMAGYKIVAENMGYKANIVSPSLFMQQVGRVKRSTKPIKQRLIIDYAGRCPGVKGHTWNGENCGPCERDKKRVFSIKYLSSVLFMRLITWMCR